MTVLCFALAISPAVRGAEAPLRIERVAAGQECRIVAVNKSAAPMTVVVKVGRAGETLTEVVAAGASRELTRNFARTEPCKVDITHSAGIGDAFATPDKGYPYRLPFAKGVRVRVTQIPGVPGGTHQDALTRYAVDFGVPVGTPVLAAREGTVIEVRDGFTVGRPDPAFAEKVNFISILHDDGTFAQYAHLAVQGIWVRPGERIEAGQVIGRSGKTGYTGGPHLHFDLRRTRIKPGGEVVQESIPITFYRRRAGEKITFKPRMRLTVD
ncbi:MAG: M23 family metallopeptidase [Azoarcus sp.]|jgi:murein DD-endopeptidase MepM/ murein hydrolase activator NlpD|nr:M23 family metallopeptidase [Azoarcus sp.]